MSTTTANKQLVRRLFEEVFPAADLDALRTLVAPDVVDHDPVPGQPPGVDGIASVVSALHAGVPDQTFTVSHLLADGDLVSARWTSRGVNSGPLFGQPPTGQVVEHTAVVILRLVDGRVVERWAGFSPTRPPRT